MTSAPGRREQIATRIVFFVAGFALAAWAPLVPFAQQRAAIGEGTLGILLLCLGIGSIATMSLAGALAARFGCRRVIMVSAVPLCVALPMLATMSDPVALGAWLLVFGAGLGAIEVTMNLQAVIVERASGRAMMSGFHGLFSLGGIAGAGVVTAELGLSLSPLVATLCVVVGIVIALLVARPNLLTYGSKTEAALFAMPHGIVLVIGAICFVAFLTEGAMLDWSAVFLTKLRAWQPAYAGMGYAVFSLMMTIGRLMGDSIVVRLGGRSVILLSGICAGAGLALTALVPYQGAAIAGFALIGIGCSNVVPVLYTAVGRQTVMPEHMAVAAITTLGYAGILAGPALIGFMASILSLQVVFLLLMAFQIGVALSGRLVTGRVAGQSR